ncbi:MAG: isoleucine--tRNA ligase [Planctomycetota bacterium]|nr:isoleucine--tRNA ligase [Planctomycetota bacterium]MDA1179088.1 isoleucine--tRNA ligase [Planctomycetota bacterium]
MFESVAQNVRFPDQETQILHFWKSRQIYEKSLEQRRSSPSFVFFEGPPTANGMPHPGHCLTRAIKDLFPRYRTMRGYLCRRKAGWDTHGLPVEVEVCKELGIHSKEEIEAFGVEPFIQKCQQSVWRYMQQWEQMTERLGFWIHLKDAYVTYHQSYVESVWWSLQRLFERGLLYQGNKIVWWWAQGGTALSAGEVGQGYRQGADPSVYVRFPLVDPAWKNTSLLVWTTTPWTLPSNQFAAVHPRVKYVVVHDAELGENLVVATDLLETMKTKTKRELSEVRHLDGQELIGLRYLPPFSYYHSRTGDLRGTLKAGGTDFVSWRVVPAEFVTTDTGTGVVHQAPAFGEVDYQVLLDQQERFTEGTGPSLLCAVGPDGKFTDEAPDYQGKWVKDADRDIIRQLRADGILYHQEQFLHDYPFCWRAEEDPLIQYPRRSWFLRTTQFRDQMLANNRKIHWMPDHIQEGRFGNFLESNVDWALSRERYWGTPLPIWVCQQTGKMEAVGRYDELLLKPGVKGLHVWADAKAANPDLPDDLRVHKPYIDAVTYDSPFAPGATMQRVTEVIDCWFDSGAMPFAQWGYPHQGEHEFQQQFPADFISEAIDQTRGWFYTLLAISTILFHDDSVEPDTTGVHNSFPHPFRNCIVLGLMLGEDGTKMSKSKRNYREPQEIFDRYGADALRWYLFANQPPWTSIRYNEVSIRDSIPEFLLRLWNVYSFFVIYANIDRFEPSRLLPGPLSQLTPEELSNAPARRAVPQRGELDRWILSELHGTIAFVVEAMDAYDNYGACQRLHAFVDALSNWYVRRSRDRFWSGIETDSSKLDAYWTLYECLVTVTKLIAPFTPFLAEAIWQNLARSASSDVLESVHLCDYPTSDASLCDPELSTRMELLREIASLGRSARMDAKLKVRQPLGKVEVVLASLDHQAWLEAHSALLCEELNVKQIEFIQHAEQYIDYLVQPNFKRLGPRVGKLLPQVKVALAQADGATLLATLRREGRVTLLVESESVTLDAEDIQVRLQARDGWAAAQGDQCVVVLSTELTDSLLREGYARELVRIIADWRKEVNCLYTDRIEIGVVTESHELQQAILENMDYIAGETLAVNTVLLPLEGIVAVDRELSAFTLQLFLRVVQEA